MDNLCHSLVGAAFSQAGLKRGTRFATPVLIVAANLPDIDALVFTTGLPSVAFRRGWTHGVLAQFLFPMVLTASVVALARLPRFRTKRPETLDPWRLLALAYVGVLSHVFLDYLNNYGVRLLMPFSGRWFYGDAVFIIDPWLWIVLGAGIWGSRGRASRWAPRVALIVSAAYMVLMLWSAQAARQVVLDLWSSAGGATPAAFMVGPAPLTPVRKGVIIDTGDSYRTGTFRWPGRLELDGTPVSKNADHPAVRRAREHAVVRSILVWARFPYYELDPVPGGTRVTLRDLRFGDRVGAATIVVPADQAQRRR